MNTTIKAAMAVSLCFAAPTLALGANKIYEAQPFTAIEITSGIDATVTVGGELSVTGDAIDQGTLDEMHVEFSDGRLKAYVDWNLLSFLLPERHLKLTISVPSLDTVDASSGADVIVSGLSGDAVRVRASSGSDLDVNGASAKRYEIDASSGADIEIDGTCESAEIDVSSGADIDAGKLLCADVDVNASSGADADVYASASVDGDASSGADVTVYGNPQTVEKDESSGGSVRTE